MSDENNFHFDDEVEDWDDDFHEIKPEKPSHLENDDLLDEYLFQKNVPRIFKIFLKDIELSRRTFFFIYFIINAIVVLIILQLGLALSVFYTKGDDAFNVLSILIGIIIGASVAYYLVDKIDSILNFFKYFICISLSITIIQLILVLSQSYGLFMNILFTTNSVIICLLYMVFFKYYLLKTSILERGRIFAYQFVLVIISLVILIASAYFLFLLSIPIFFIIISIFLLHTNREKNQKLIKKRWKIRKRRIYTSNFIKYYFFIAFFGLTAGFATPYEASFQIIGDAYVGNILIVVFIVGLFIILAPVIVGLIFDYFGRTGALSFIIIAIALSNYSNLFGIEGIPTAVVFSAYIVALMSIPLLVGDMTSHDNYGRMLSASNFFLGIGVGTGLILRSITEVVSVNPDFTNTFIISTTFMICITCVIILANMQETLPRKEQDWKEFLIHLYIVHHSGMLLYEYGFIKDNENSSPDLVSGGIVGLISLLKEIVRGEKQVKTIDHEDRKIMFKSNEQNNVYFALVVEEELLTFRNKLDSLIKDFDFRYREVVREISESGVDQDDFLDLKYYVRKYFGV